MFIPETFFMLLATVVSFYYKGDDFYAFLQTTCLMLGTGALFTLIGYNANDRTAGRREGMLIVSFTWIFFSLFGMLPFYLSGYIDNVTDAFFETMSGFTTTGSTVLRDIEALPHGIDVSEGDDMTPIIMDVEEVKEEVEEIIEPVEETIEPVEEVIEPVEEVIESIEEVPEIIENIEETSEVVEEIEEVIEPEEILEEDIEIL